MLLSKLCSNRTKEVPSDAKMVSHRLMIRAGYMKQVANGIYTLTALGQRAALNIENIIRDEMNRLGGQEVKFPVVMPKELWDLSGRYDSIGSEMVRFDDRGGHKMLLGMTHEEAAVHLAKNWVSSYTALPFMIYQIQTKFRDEPRSRAGLIRVREFTMKDAYSFHESQEDLQSYYDKMHDAYMRIYEKIGLKNYISVKSDTGMMGGSVAHEFMSLNAGGEDELVICKCGYSSNQEIAKCVYQPPLKVDAKFEKVYTGEAATIEEVCKKFDIAPNKTAKAVAFAVKGEDTIVLAFVRGDKEVNEAKLKRVTGKDIAPFSAEDDKRLCAGNIGPVDFKQNGVILVLDKSLEGASGMCVGANEKEYHLVGVDFERDVQGVDYHDISKVQEGDICPVCCKNKVKICNGIEIGNIFQLGTKYTASMGMKVKNAEGGEFSPIMGCYGIGVGRNLACVIEDNHDEFGIIMPKSIAPYKVHICPLRLDDARVSEVAGKIYEELFSRGVEPLYDDRNTSAGTKFADADLIGMPVRVVVSPKGLDAGTVELKDRITGEVKVVPVSGATDEILKLAK